MTAIYFARILTLSLPAITAQLGVCAIALFLPRRLLSLFQNWLPHISRHDRPCSIHHLEVSAMTRFAPQIQTNSPFKTHSV